MIGLARRTRRVIRQNLFWAFGYNTVGMALAATGMLNPVVAAGLMFGSSAFVLWNSRRLSHFELLTTHEQTIVTALPTPVPTTNVESVGEAVGA